MALFFLPQRPKGLYSNRPIHTHIYTLVHFGSHVRFSVLLENISTHGRARLESNLQSCNKRSTSRQREKE